MCDTVTDVLKLALLWAVFSLALPMAWWLLHSEWIVGQMIQTAEGLAVFALSFVLALLVSALIRRPARQSFLFAGDVPAEPPPSSVGAVG